MTREDGQAMSSLRSSKHYIWNTGDVLGTGATGAVYKGRNKKTGDVVAVKTFNQVSYMRPYEVQMREFEVLLKLNHKNIVRLHDIEEEQSTRQNVIVMELCTGSLYTMLDEPENAYGLSEDEFKQVLKDVAAGMEHLKERNIVHRDLKPGNIMRVRGEDGSSIYKLADFGAARELDDNQQFMSLYGTEEYLHPDLYERAVLRKPMGKTFSASVDLWSIGVTLYHVAAGSLPFRPYGGRRNRETMYYITTQKASGVISGVQKDESGDIIWSKELPKTTQLSQGLKDLVTPVLAGLMECDPNTMWTFEEFISATRRILTRKVIDVFNVTKAKLHKIYVPPHETFAEFQDLIAAQTEISVGNQELYLGHENFCPDPRKQCATYPHTKEDSPVFLFRKDLLDFPHAMPVHIPKIPKVSSTYSLDADSSAAKMSAAVMYYIKRTMQSIIQVQALMSRSVKIFKSIVKQELKELRCFQQEIRALDAKGKESIHRMRSQAHSPMITMVCMTLGRPANAAQTELHEMREKVIKLSQDLEELSHKFEEQCATLNRLCSKICEEDELSHIWKDQAGCQPNDKCIARLDVLLDTVAGIAVQFKKEKAMKRLQYNEEQIHKFEKLRLTTLCGCGVSLYQDHCEPNLSIVHKQLSTWFKTAGVYRRDMTAVDGELSELMEKYETFSFDIINLDTELGKKMANISSSLEGVLKEQLQKKSTFDAAMSNGHGPGPVSPKQKVLIPRDLKEEMKIWQKNIKEINNGMDNNTYLMRKYRNRVDELQRGLDRDVALEEEANSV
ncbi:serine/threonine-protein kinase TBK1-like isoform X2 [Ptychodera flava]|uniref:serine/threonine-protein kinase TBK1-like isoform X2 n=1 Tax=Ptychodera flava TaxID=63121 RepID=UPI00396A8E82